MDLSEIYILNLISYKDKGNVGISPTVWAAVRYLQPQLNISQNQQGSSYILKKKF